MDGGSSGARSVVRGALAAAVIVVALTLTAGPAMANDRSTEVVCVDRSTGAWRASMTFSSIDVHDGHPVVVTFGSAPTTLAEPGAGGSATLSQDAGGDEASATWSWSIARNGVVEQAGSARFTRPAGCEGTPVDGTPADGTPADGAPGDRAAVERTPGDRAARHGAARGADAPRQQPARRPDVRTDRAADHGPRRTAARNGPAGGPLRRHRGGGRRRGRAGAAMGAPAGRSAHRGLIDAA